MPIRYDRTSWSHVVVCTDCGWQDLGVSKEAAWSLAADHEARVHPTDHRVRNAAAKRARYSEPDP
jgi:hypothetical protein